MTEPYVVEIEHWRGVDPQTGEQDTDRWTITFGGRNVLTFRSEIECYAKIREYGWRVRDREAL